MAGDNGPDDSSGDDDAEHLHPAEVDQQSVRREVIARLRHQLALMRGQVRRLQDALCQAERVRVSARERLDSLRISADSLEQALRLEEAAQQDLPLSERPSPPFGNKGAAPLWTPLPGATSDGGVCHLVTIDLRERHVHALLASGLLAIADMDNGPAVRRVVQSLLDRWSGHFSGNEGGYHGRERRSRRARRRHGGDTVPLLVSGDEPTENRRSGGDRRSQADTSASVEGMEGADRRTTGSASSPAERVTGSNIGKIIFLAEVHATRRDGLQAGVLPRGDDAVDADVRLHTAKSPVNPKPGRLADHDHGKPEVESGRDGLKKAEGVEGEVGGRPPPKE